MAWLSAQQQRHAASTDLPAFERFGSWPFFAPPAPPTTAPFLAAAPQPQLHLPDDILAGLLSTEGRAAGEAASQAATFDSSSLFASLGLFGNSGAAPTSAAMPSPWPYHHPGPS